jgi:antitoxin component YwqK of YwqJK toxin-antitoxin module
VYVTKAPAEGRYETTCANGVPDGPFRAYYADGKLWAEATYVRGVPSGRHVVYNHAGKIIYETVFAPGRR